MDISVIIPAFNSKDRIGKCIKSVLKQDFKNLEVIVVNDGSNDSTAETAKKAGAKVYSKMNQGPAIARNFGAQKAAGKILVFMDDDCIAQKNWLFEMVKLFEDPKVAGVQGAYKTTQTELCARFSQIEIEDRYDRIKKAKKIDWIGSYSAAYRRDVFFEFNGFDSSFSAASGEDPELSFKISKAGHKLAFNPNAVVFHRHDSSFKAYFRRKFFRAYWRVLLYKKHRDKIVSDSYTPQSIKLQITIFALMLLAPFCTFIFGTGIVFLAMVELLFFALLFATTIPFTAKAIRKDFEVGLVSPPILIGRSVVFLMGLVFGGLKGVWMK